MATSVIIPVRNRPRLVARAIRSLQAQALPVDEIVVVDDGSTDDTPDVVADIARQDPRIQLIRLQPAGGANRARNAGARRARGERLAFLDSDDQWLPEKHALQVEALKRAPEAVAAFTGVRCDFGHWASDHPAAERADKAALRTSNVLGTTSTAMVRREAFERAGAFDEDLPSCQDWDLWLRLADEGAFAIVREPLVIYDSSAPERISSQFDGVIAGHLTVFARALAGVENRRERTTIAALHTQRLAELHYDAGRYGSAVWLALKGFAGRPRLRPLVVPMRLLGRAVLPTPARTALRRLHARKPRPTPT